MSEDKENKKPERKASGKKNKKPDRVSKACGLKIISVGASS